MSRRRRPAVRLVRVPHPEWFRLAVLRPVEAARRERVQRQIARVKRRAAKRWTA